MPRFHNLADTHHWLEQRDRDPEQPYWTHTIREIGSPEARRDYLQKISVVRFTINQVNEQKLDAPSALLAVDTTLKTTRGFELVVATVATSVFDPLWAPTQKPEVLQDYKHCVLCSADLCAEYAGLSHRYDIHAD